MMFNNTPIKWVSKRQKTLDASRENQDIKDFVLVIL
jgi:hypothetical protein